jgi:hypothetical protein
MFDRHAQRVYAYAARRSSPDMASEVVAETFLIAWQKLDAVPADPLPWLLNVAGKVLANRRRSSLRRDAFRSRTRRRSPWTPPATARTSPGGSAGRPVPRPRDADRPRCRRARSGLGSGRRGGVLASARGRNPSLIPREASPCPASTTLRPGDHAVRSERPARRTRCGSLAPTDPDERSDVAANVGHLQFGTPLKGKSIRKTTRGRVCRTDGCTTVLSIYNASDDCSVHEYRSLNPRRERP